MITFMSIVLDCEYMKAINHKTYETYMGLIDLYTARNIYMVKAC